MTTGVKIVTLNTGDTTITLDTHGYVPAGVLFFGAHQGTDFATRFTGASDGARQWSTAEYRKSGISSSETYLTGICNRSDWAITMLSRSGTRTQIDAAAKVVSFAVDTITLDWVHNLSAGSWPITAVVFFGSQYTIRCGLCNSASALPAPIDAPKFYPNPVGFQPDCVIVASAANRSFSTALPVDNLSFSHYWSLGWCTWPTPLFVPPQDFFTGYPGTEERTQRYMFTAAYQTPRATSFQMNILEVGRVANLGNFTMSIERLSNGFGLSHGYSGPNGGAPSTVNYGYIAFKWRTGRFTTGWLHPANGGTSSAYDRFGGSYNAGGTDTAPSEHADPSFMFFFLNNKRPETSSFYTNSLTFGAAAKNGTTTDYGGYAYGGGFTTFAPNEENVTQIGSSLPLLPTSGTSPIVAATVSSWDGDGVTLDYASPIPSASFYWPYLAMTRDTGFLEDEITFAVTEPRDTFSGSVLANRRSVTLNATERADTLSAYFQVTDGIVLGATEPNDTWLSTSHQGGMSAAGDGEFIYPEPEIREIPVPVEDLLILQQSDADMSVDSEDRTIRVWREDLTIIVPPVEEGAWI